MARRLCGRCYAQHKKRGTLGEFPPAQTGSIIKANGYRYIWAPGHPLAHADNYVGEHRLVLYDAGRLPDPAMEVHHRNHDKLDNRPENLVAMSPGAHRRDHAENDGVTNQYGHFLAVHGHTCEIDGCQRPARSRRWCVAHYTRWARHGDPLVVTKVLPATIEPYRLIPTRSG